MFGYGNYNFMNMLGSSSLMSNAFSPATQMCFQGTNSIFNLGNWNVYGGSSYCGGCTGYSNGQILGYSAAMGLGFIGSILLNSWASKKMAQASQPSAQQQANNAVKEMNNLAKQIGADNWEEALESGYKTPKHTELEEQNAELTGYLTDLDNTKLKTLLPTEAKAYNNAKEAYEAFGSDINSSTNGYKKRLDAQLAIINDPNSTQAQKDAAEEAKAKIESEYMDEKAKAEQAKEDAKKALEKAINDKIEANNKLIEKEQEKVADIQEKIENIRDAKYEPNQQAADEELIDDLDGTFLGRKSDKRLNDKFNFTSDNTIPEGNTEVPNSRDLKTAAYNYRTAKSNDDRKAWAKKFVSMYLLVENTKTGKEFKPIADAIGREYNVL